MLETIDIKELTDDNKFAILDDKNTLDSINSNSFKSSEDILIYIDRKLGHLIYDIGLDSRILKLSSFSPEVYYKTVKDYEEKFKSGQININEYIKAGYEYMTIYLNNSSVITCNEQEYYMVCDDYNNDTINIINRLYQELNNHDEYKYLNEFIEFINNHEVNLELKMKREVK